MKVVSRAIMLSAILLASAGSASATSWIQASSTEEQLASDKPKVVTMNSTDGSKNIKQEKGVVRVNENGSFFLMAAAQIGGKGKGLVRMWMRVNGKDVDNSNTEQLINDGFTTVLVCQGVAELKRGDRIEVVFSGSDPGVGLVVKKPAGEPVVPSIIFSGWRID